MMTMLRTRGGLLAAALLALPLAGCDSLDLLGLGELEGTYELNRVDDHGLPYEIDTYTLSDDTRCELDVVAGSLVLEETGSSSSDWEDGVFELQIAYRETCRTRSGRIDVTYPHERESGEYERRSEGGIRFYPYNNHYFDDFDASISGSEVSARIGDHRFRFREDRTIGR